MRFTPKLSVGFLTQDFIAVKWTKLLLSILYLCLAFLLLLFLTLLLPVLFDNLCFKELGVESPLVNTLKVSFESFGVPGLLSSPTADSILLSLPNVFCNIPDEVAIFWVALCLVWWLKLFSILPLMCCFPAGLVEAILSVDPCIVVWFKFPSNPELICVSDESSLVCDSVSLFLSSKNQNIFTICTLFYYNNKIKINGKQ